MTLIGITGGIGAGKSVSSGILDQFGIPVSDADVLARECSGPGTEGFTEIVREFGPGVLRPCGELDRKQLAAVIFPNPQARQRLEAILHPRIARLWRSQVSAWRSEGVRCAAVVIPLLFEKGYAGEFSRVVCLACTRSTQLCRLRERGWTVEQIDARNAAQLAVTEKMARADFVVWTEGSPEMHRRQWERILALVA